jgi:hypothetical protein
MYLLLRHLQAVLREGARLLVTPATLSSLHEALTPESQAQWRVWSEPTGAAADELAVPTYQQPSTPQDSSQANTGSGGSSPESRMAAYVSRLPITNTPLGPVSAIINCTGLGARSLVGDPLVRPIRGQVMRVRAPWVKQVLIAGGWAGGYDADEPLLRYVLHSNRIVPTQHELAAPCLHPASCYLACSQGQVPLWPSCLLQMSRCAGYSLSS